MICSHCGKNEVTGVLFGGAGPADYCDPCKQECYDTGREVVSARAAETATDDPANG